MTDMHEPASYDPTPVYPPVEGRVLAGWSELAVQGMGHGTVLAVDGPSALNWSDTVAALRAAVEAAGFRVELCDVRDYLLDWPSILASTETTTLADDPHFATLAAGTLDELFTTVPAPAPPPDGLLIAFGPGAALVTADRLWYADSPKRFAEADVQRGRARNLGQRPPDGHGTLRRLFYVDWPLQDRHRDRILDRIDLWVDVRDPGRPTALDGRALRRTLQQLAARPFRTRPTFNTTSWGGHWAQKTLGMGLDAPNTALGYELIAPESGILLGHRGGDLVEVPFQLLVAAHPRQVLGAEVHAQFGTSFPIRFDYLDTVGGGNLSVHCHPRADYMRDVFGWPYTQHETYYMMVGGDDRRVFLGLREDADIDVFHRQAHRANEAGMPFDIEAFIQTFPATPHQLFLIPAGTPHGSGEGNVVLEISATPYLYSLRFYDWLRGRADGQPRPIHLEHAFDNLDHNRRGAAVAADLVPQPRLLHRGDGWREDLLGALPDMFFDVRRLEIDPAGVVAADTDDRFHVLNVVDGPGVTVTTKSGADHRLHYAETLVIPAAAGPYRLTAMEGDATRVVKALVR